MRARAVLVVVAITGFRLRASAMPLDPTIGKEFGERAHPHDRVFGGGVVSRQAMKSRILEARNFKLKTGSNVVSGFASPHGSQSDLRSAMRFQPLWGPTLLVSGDHKQLTVHGYVHSDYGHTIEGKYLDARDRVRARKDLAKYALPTTKIEFDHVPTEKVIDAIDPIAGRCSS